jgi:hypothetical protein
MSAGMNRLDLRSATEIRYRRRRVAWAREPLSLLLAVAIVAPVGLIAEPAAAAGGTTCRTQTGNAVSRPGIHARFPKPPKAQVITAKLAIGRCTGGVVVKGVATLKFKKTRATHCQNFFATTGSKLALSRQSEFRWNTGKTSTMSGTVTWGPEARQWTIALKVTKGPFVGKKATTIVSFAPRPSLSACNSDQGVRKLKIKSVKPFVIK